MRKSMVENERVGRGKVYLKGARVGDQRGWVGYGNEVSVIKNDFSNQTSFRKISVCNEEFEVKIFVVVSD